MSARDRIELRGIRGVGFHGVLPSETAQGQEFSVDAVLELDLSAAGASDDLEDTVHYGLAAERIHAEIVGEPVQLIEALAERIAARVLDLDARIAAVEIAVHKPHAPIPVPFAEVAVRIRRDRTLDDAAGAR